MIICNLGESESIIDQLLNLVDAVIAAKRSGSKVILCNNFIVGNDVYYVDQIIDRKKFNSEFNIDLISESEITNFDIISLSYGIDMNNKIDVKNIVYEYFSTTKRLEFTSNTNLNNIFSDPYPQRQKTLFIEYVINDNIYIEEHIEHAERLIVPVTFGKSVLKTDVITDAHTGSFKVLHYEKIIRRFPVKFSLDLLADYRKLMKRDLMTEYKIKMHILNK